CLLRADGKGRLYLLSAKSLTAFRFSAGALAAKSRMPLKARNPPGLVLDAAACSDDDWVILDLNPAPTVRLFVRGEEKVLPQPEWGVNGVACPGGSPAVVVSPGKPSGAPVGPLSSTAPDLMLRWDGETWAPYVDRLLDLRGKASGWEFVEKSEAASQVVTTTDHRGWLWVGQSGFYNVRRITASGRVDTTLESGPMTVSFSEVSGEERKRIEGEIRRKMSAADASRFLAHLPRSSIARCWVWPKGRTAISTSS